MPIPYGDSAHDLQVPGADGLRRAPNCNQQDRTVGQNADVGQRYPRRTAAACPTNLLLDWGDVVYRVETV
jgi:hypothetical protein